MCKKSCGKGCCTLSMVAKVLVIIGGLNWGLVGLGMLLGSMTGWNVVSMLLGGVPVIEAIVYLLVGVSALLMCCGCRCGTCKGSSCEGGACTPSSDAMASQDETASTPSQEEASM